MLGDAGVLLEGGSTGVRPAALGLQASPADGALAIDAVGTRISGEDVTNTLLPLAGGPEEPGGLLPRLGIGPPIGADRN